MRTIRVKRHQTLFDIALQEYGDVEGVFWIVKDNGLNGVVSSTVEGQKILIRNETINNRMVKYLRPHTIATGLGAKGEGIGFWIIESDFVIS